MITQMFPYWNKSGKASEKITSFHAQHKLKHSSEDNIRTKRRRFVCDIFFLALCSDLLPLCYAGAGAGKRLKGEHYNEFHTLLTVLALLLCIVGIFGCLWCTCCGHHDYFTILDRRRFQQENVNSDEV